MSYSNFFRTALVLTSCWAASYFSLQYSSTRSPQPTSRTSPSPHTVHHHHKLTTSLFPGLLFQPTYGTLLAHENSFYQGCLEPNGVHTGQGENVRITLRPSDLLSPSRSASNKMTGSTLSAVRRIGNLGDDGKFVFGVERVVEHPINDDSSFEAALSCSTCTANGE